VAGSEGEPLFFNYPRDMLGTLLSPGTFAIYLGPDGWVSPSWAGGVGECFEFRANYVPGDELFLTTGTQVIWNCWTYWSGVELGLDTAGCPANDCNENCQSDNCDILIGQSQDCNQNGVPDKCDLASGSSSDCDANLVPDDCQSDCNGNHILDSCDVANCPDYPMRTLQTVEKLRSVYDAKTSASHAPQASFRASSAMRSICSRQCSKVIR